MLLRSTILLLIVMGVASAVMRGLSVSGVAREEVVAFEQQVLRSLRPDPAVPRAVAEVLVVEDRLASQPLLTFLHIVAGSLFLILGAVQFSSRVRRRYLAFHRWSGRMLVASSFVGTVASFYYGILHPYGGITEVTSIAFFGLFFMTALGRGVYAIRKGDVEHHREWMIRAFSLALGISIIRIVTGILAAVTTAPGEVLLGRAFWIGWSLSLIAGELWIRHTRHSPMILTSTLLSRRPSNSP